MAKVAFNDIELMNIKKTVGKMCERRSPPHLRNELRTVYEVKGYDVIVYEAFATQFINLGWNHQPYIMYFKKI
jgi:hypothetical protein